MDDNARQLIKQCAAHLASSGVEDNTQLASKLLSSLRDICTDDTKHPTTTPSTDLPDTKHSSPQGSTDLDSNTTPIDLESLGYTKEELDIYMGIQALQLEPLSDILPGLCEYSSEALSKVLDAHLWEAHWVTDGQVCGIYEKFSEIDRLKSVVPSKRLVCTLVIRNFKDFVDMQLRNNTKDIDESIDESIVDILDHILGCDNMSGIIEILVKKIDSKSNIYSMILNASEKELIDIVDGYLVAKYNRFYAKHLDNMSMYMKCKTTFNRLSEYLDEEPEFDETKCFAIMAADLYKPTLDSISKGRMRIIDGSKYGEFVYYLTHRYVDELDEKTSDDSLLKIYSVFSHTLILAMCEKKRLDLIERISKLCIERGVICTVRGSKFYTTYDL